MATSSAPKKRQLRVADKSDASNGPNIVASAPKRLLRGLGIGRTLRPILNPLAAVGRRIVPSYFRTSWRELRMVTWPNFKQTRQLTSAVILFALVFGIIVAVFDYGLDRLFKEVIK